MHCSRATVASIESSSIRMMIPRMKHNYLYIYYARIIIPCFMANKCWFHDYEERPLQLLVWGMAQAFPLGTYLAVCDHGTGRRSSGTATMHAAK